MIFNILRTGLGLLLGLFVWVNSIHSRVAPYNSLDFEPKSILLESWESEGWSAITFPKTPVGHVRVAMIDGRAPGVLINNNNKLLGLSFAFVYPGFNKIEILPPKNMTVTRYTGEFTVDGERSRYTTVGMELPGRVKTIAVWVLSKACECYVEAVLEDWKGTLHSVYLGDLREHGWSHKKVEIPGRISQSIGKVADRRLLLFRKFVVRTYATSEALGTSFLYFDSFKITTELNESRQDGLDIVFDEEDRAEQRRATGYLEEVIPYKSQNHNSKITNGTGENLLPGETVPAN